MNALPDIPKLAAFRPTEIESCTGERKICSYYEDHGKDQNEQSGRRWRVTFYYAPGMALTAFFYSEMGKDGFLLGLNPVETDYNDWKSSTVKFYN